MKKLIFLFLFIPVLADCQNGVYQTTGPNLQPQIAQYQKTIDSLNTALISEKKANLSLQDTITRLKSKISILSYSLDTLSARLSNILNPVETMDSLLLSSLKNKPINAFIFKDSIANTNAIINQKIYDVAPYFKFQTIHRYPIDTSTGTKTKEITITEIE